MRERVNENRKGKTMKDEAKYCIICGKEVQIDLATRIAKKVWPTMNPGNSPANWKKLYDEHNYGNVGSDVGRNTFTVYYDGMDKKRWVFCGGCTEFYRLWE